MKKLALLLMCCITFFVSAQSVDNLSLDEYPKIIKSEKIGWNSSDFEPYLKKYNILYGKPTYENTSNGGEMEWVWVGKKNVLSLKYIMKNSLAPATTQIDLIEKSKY
ncbi:hypothetical protein [Epilithonimonas vandammei]|uniref:hypothetical protein n=1 Tax=Epilithonimonas vandammei TaxID=2487072 RepID=UPI0028ABC33F|nr:hypothetical protein [Epilithonimonas vandammei]